MFKKLLTLTIFLAAATCFATTYTNDMGTLSDYQGDTAGLEVSSGTIRPTLQTTVNHLSCDDTSGTTITNDGGGAAGNGTLTGANSAVNIAPLCGTDGKAVNVAIGSGSGEIFCNKDFMFFGTNRYSVGGWLKLSVFSTLWGNPQDGGIYVIGTATPKWRFVQILSGGSSSLVDIDGGGAGVPTVNKTFFVVSTWDGVTMNNYIGRPDLNTNMVWAETRAVASIKQSVSAFRVGSYPGGANQSRGTFDDIFSFDGVLTYDQINALYYNGTGRRFPVYSWVSGNLSGEYVKYLFTPKLASALNLSHAIDALTGAGISTTNTGYGCYAAVGIYDHTNTTYYDWSGSAWVASASYSINDTTAIFNTNVGAFRTAHPYDTISPAILLSATNGTRATIDSATITYTSDVSPPGDVGAVANAGVGTQDVLINFTESGDSTLGGTVIVASTDGKTTTRILAASATLQFATPCTGLLCSEGWYGDARLPSDHLWLDTLANGTWEFGAQTRSIWYDYVSEASRPSQESNIQWAAGSILIPIPTATPYLSPTPLNTATQAPTSTPVVTQTPYNTPTAVPTSTPYDTPTAVPTNTQPPTATPANTCTPVATVTPFPTWTPMPTWTARPTWTPGFDTGMRPSTDGPLVNVPARGAVQIFDGQ